MIRRALSCQAAVLVGTASLLLITYLGLAVDAAQHHLMPFDQGIRGWVQPMRSSVLDLSVSSVDDSSFTLPEFSSVAFDELASSSILSGPSVTFCFAVVVILTVCC